MQKIFNSSVSTWQNTTVSISQVFEKNSLVSLLI